MLLSLVVPCYNEEGNVTRFYDAAANAFRGDVFEYEMIFVDDGSSDGTFSEIESLHKEHGNIRALSFSRNFGKEAAMLAGLRAARGERVCIIDADLQQRPETVLDMMRLLDEDEALDCVAAYQEKRNEGKFISFLKSSFYKIINKLSEVDFVNGASDFRLMRRPMVDAILALGERQRFMKGIFGYVGFKTKFIPITHEKREIGTTKWGVLKLFKYAIHGIVAFTTAPLRLPIIAGALSLAASLIYFLSVLIYNSALISISSTATAITLMLAIGGVTLISLGVIAEYLAKMYSETKARPVYFIRRELDNAPSNLSDEAEKIVNEAESKS